MAICTVCLTLLAREPNQSTTASTYECQRCGRFTLIGTAVGKVGQLSDHQRAVLSHRLRCQQTPEHRGPQIFESDLNALALNDLLPNPAEQIDRLVTWVGNNQPTVSEFIYTTTDAMAAWVGTAITYKNPNSGLGWILAQQVTMALLEIQQDGRGSLGLRLKLDGWNRYTANKRAQTETSTAFMAMQFDPALMRIVEDHFKPAVARAGFELKLLTDNQPAGLIDDQLRVALRTARFVVADLTHANNGAYWEAGFAEGLGKPVIYTCRKAEWDEVDERGRKKVHFDTNHLVTIIWSPDALEDAANRLTATIRATLPGEARLSD